MSLEQKIEVLDTPAPTKPTLTKPTARSQIGIILAVGATILFWASSFAAIREALHAYSPTHLALLRYLIASLILAGYALIKRMPLPRWRDIPVLLLSGIAGIAVYNVGLNTGELSVSAGIASFLINTAPIMTTLLAMIILKERPRSWVWVGILLSACGVAIIALSSDSGFHVSLGALLILLAALAESFYFVWQKPYLAHYSAVQCTTYAIWGGTLAMLIFSPGLLTDLHAAPWSSTAAIVFLAIFPGVIAYVSWSYVMARIPAARATSLLYLIPPLALTIAWFWLSEWPAWLALLGGLIAISGVILANVLGQARRKSS